MIKAINNGQTITANTTVNLTNSLSTNSAMTINNNAININKPGYYKIDADFVVVATVVGDVTVQMYANGAAIPETIRTISLSGIGDYGEIVINDIEKVINTYNLNAAQITFVFSTACTLNNAEITAFEIR